MPNYFQYFGVIPATLIAVVAATQPEDAKSKLLEIGYAVLTLIGTLLFPYVLGKVRKLTREMRESNRKSASTTDVDDVLAKFKTLESQVAQLQTAVDLTTEERDSLLREIKEKDHQFQETLLKMSNDHATETKRLNSELASERELNSDLSRQYDRLAQEFRELKQEVAIMRGINEFANQIMAGIANLQKGAV